jgi:mono/diheme cytochrome c family protein
MTLIKGILSVFGLLVLTASPLQAGETDVSTGPTAGDELPSSKMAATPELIAEGKAIYERRCLPCHGQNGEGDGAASFTMDPRPRNFAKGLYKFKSTPPGQPPTDEDLFRIISRGIPGTGMASWKRLSEKDRWAVVHYIKTLSPRFKETATSTPITMGQEPASGPDSIAKGKEIFLKKAQPACALCHGENGRGNGPLAPALRDALGNPLYPRNLTKPWTYKSGHEAKDIFMRDSAGIEGTPMPGYMNSLSEEERWHLAHFIQSLHRELTPEGKVVIEAQLMEGEIPTDPKDPFWQGIQDRVDVRMTGQVHVAPRNQNPTIDIVTVKTAYNEKEVAFYLEWDDRTKSAAHQETELTQKWEAADFSTPYPVIYPPEARITTPLRDGVGLQFPVRIPEGPVKPHFFLGHTGNPVNLWHWKADRNEATDGGSPVEELNAAGYAQPAKLQPAESQRVQGKGVFEDGLWRVVMKRPLTTQDAAGDIQFVPGRMVPVAVHVWDGANGETGIRRTISSWYFVMLKAQVPPSVYLKTAGAIGLVAGLQYWLIRRVKRQSSQ